MTLLALCDRVHCSAHVQLTQLGAAIAWVWNGGVTVRRFQKMVRHGARTWKGAAVKPRCLQKQCNQEFFQLDRARVTSPQRLFCILSLMGQGRRDGASWHFVGGAAFWTGAPMVSHAVCTGGHGGSIAENSWFVCVRFCLVPRKTRAATKPRAPLVRSVSVWHVGTKANASFGVSGSTGDHNDQDSAPSEYTFVNCSCAVADRLEPRTASHEASALCLHCGSVHLATYRHTSSTTSA